MEKAKKKEKEKKRPAYQNTHDVAHHNEKLLPVTENISNVPPRDLLVILLLLLLVAPSEIPLQALHRVLSFLVREEPRLGRNSRQHKKADQRHKDRQSTFKQEHDLPSVQNSRFEPHQPVRDQSRKGSRNRVHPREQTHAQSQREFRVEQGHVVERRRGEASLPHAQQQAQRKEGGGTMHTHMGNAQATPDDHQRAHPPFGPDSPADHAGDGLQGHICRRELEIVSRLIVLVLCSSSPRGESKHAPAIGSWGCHWA